MRSLANEFLLHSVQIYSFAILVRRLPQRGISRPVCASQSGRKSSGKIKLMKPTPQQIEAALAWNDWIPSDPKTRPISSHLQTLEESKLTGEVRALTVARILAASYREQQRELEELRDLSRINEEHEAELLPEDQSWEQTVIALREERDALAAANRMQMSIALQREDSIPAFAAFLRCEAQHGQSHVILLNVQACMAPELEDEQGRSVEMSREDRIRLIITSLMHEFGHALESHFKLPVYEYHIEKACEKWESAYMNATLEGES